MNTDVTYGVYSISYQNILLYIGSTNDFVRRKKEHLKKLKDGKHQKTLQKYINENVKNLNDLKFEIIHKTQDDSKIRLFFAEMICILLYKPACNKAVFQIGMRYVSLGKPKVQFNKEILKYL